MNSAISKILVMVATIYQYWHLEVLLEEIACSLNNINAKMLPVMKKITIYNK